MNEMIFRESSDPVAAEYAGNAYNAGNALLSIINELTELMGGTIEVKSVYGEGSEFICTIPQEIADASPIGKINPELTGAQISTERAAFTAPDAAVLVVDDIEMNLIVFKSLVKRNMLTIDTAGSGKKALEMIRNKKYDIIFMDHMMPEMSGIETFEKMKETKHLNGDTPVVMLTANVISGEKEKYMSMGFSSYLTKPIQSEKLERLLLELLPPEKINNEQAGDKSAEKPQSGEAPGGRFAAMKQAVPDFDLETALKNCSGSEEFYIELLKDFAVPQKITELEEAFAAKDW